MLNGTERFREDQHLLVEFVPVLCRHLAESHMISISITSISINISVIYCLLELNTLCDIMSICRVRFSSVSPPGRKISKIIRADLNLQIDRATSLPLEPVLGGYKKHTPRQRNT